MRFDMWDSNSSGDWAGDEWEVVEWVVCEGWAVSWGVVEWAICENWAVSWGVVEAMDLGSDTVKDFELVKV